MINKESASQEIPNPAVSSNTNPTCNDATISLKMGGWGAEATTSHAQTSAKKIINHQIENFKQRRLFIEFIE